MPASHADCVERNRGIRLARSGQTPARQSQLGKGLSMTRYPTLANGCIHNLSRGDFNVKDRNYRGAELRFRDALTYKPDSPDATFKLAQSLDGLGKNDAAKNGYQNYLAMQP